MNRGLLIALVAAVAVLAVGVAGIAGYVFWIMPKNADAPKVDAAQSVAGPTLEKKIYKMAHFVTNLADTDRLRYIDVTIGLGMKTDTDTVVKEAEPQIREVVLSEIRKFTSADLSGSAGQEKLATAIQGALQPLLQEHVSKVYISDMVIQ